MTFALALQYQSNVITLMDVHLLHLQSNNLKLSRRRFITLMCVFVLFFFVQNRAVINQTIITLMIGKPATPLCNADVLLSTSTRDIL